MTTNRKMAISWIELLLIAMLTLSGMGIWAFAEHQVSLYLKDQEPQEDYFQREAEVPILEGKLDIAKSELAAVQTKLNDQKLYLAQQEFKMAALAAAHPELVDPAHKPADDSATVELRKDYDKSRIELEATKNLVDALNKSLANDLNAVAGCSSDLAKARKSSAQKFVVSQDKFVRHRKLNTLLRASLFIAGFLLLAFLLTYILAAKQSSGIKRSVVFGGTTLLLLVLLAYQTFEVMGAAIAGTFILIFLLIFLPRQSLV